MATLNIVDVCLETLAAEYESDAALAEWSADHPDEKGFPPLGDYFWAAWAVELDLRDTDFEHARAGLRNCSHRIT